jgi:two-component system, LytTR family, response regulator
MQAMTKIRTLIVDDERPARLKIRRFLEREPDVVLLADAASGTEAVDRISSDRPDLVFLDVQMPGLDGFGVLAALDLEPLPKGRVRYGA